MFVAGLLPEILFLYCAVLTLYLVGIADDLIGVKYRAKFVVQIILRNHVDLRRRMGQ